MRGREDRLRSRIKKTKDKRIEEKMSSIKGQEDTEEGNERKRRSPSIKDQEEKEEGNERKRRSFSIKDQEDRRQEEGNKKKRRSSSIKDQEEEEGLLKKDCSISELRTESTLWPRARLRCTRAELRIDLVSRNSRRMLSFMNSAATLSVKPISTARNR